MFGRKIAVQSKELLEYLAQTQSEERRRIADQLAATDEKNAALESTKSELERLLTDALDRDSFIDLDGLKRSPVIPAFAWDKPRRHNYLPRPLSGIESLLPWKRSAYRDQYEAAEAKFKKDRRDHAEALIEHQALVDREQAEVAAHNENVELYKQEFSAGETNAVVNYFELVLENSVYPTAFPKKAQVAFAVETKALRVDFSMPQPDVIPETSSYIYDETRDEISPKALSRKQRRRLYSSMLAQISLRSIYEVFKADRTEKVDRIEFGGYVDGTNPGTGQPGRFCLVALNVTRQQYDSLDLRRVEPLSCLKGLNARLSSRPDQLLAVPLITLDDSRAATVSNAAELPYPTQRISELESANQTQSDEIIALERKLTARRDKNAELASTLRNKQAIIAELEGRLESQRDRIAELVPELRDEQKRGTELQVEIQRQKDYIAELESRLEARADDNVAYESESAKAPDDTQPAAAITDITSGSEFSEEEIFAPITSETPDDGAGGAAIPPREPERQTSKDAAQTPALLEIMSVFAEAQGRYVDYIVRGLSKEQVNRLVREGRLERHRLDAHKLRATLAGNRWYRQQSNHQDQPASETPVPQVTVEAEKTISLGELLRDQAGSPAAADGQPKQTARTDSRAAELLQQSAASSADILTDVNELVSCIDQLGRDEAKLLTLMRQGNWACSEARIQSAFPGQFISSIILDINEYVYEAIEDHIIEEAGDLLVVDEDYRHALEQALKLTDNQYINPERGNE